MEESGSVTGAVTCSCKCGCLCVREGAMQEGCSRCRHKGGLIVNTHSRSSGSAAGSSANRPFIKAELIHWLSAFVGGGSEKYTRQIWPEKVGTRCQRPLFSTSYPTFWRGLIFGAPNRLSHGARPLSPPPGKHCRGRYSGRLLVNL